MKELLILCFGFLLCFGIAISGPLVALAEVVDIKTEPKQRCGMRCVIETKMFDNHDQAIEFAQKQNSKVYTSKGLPGKWFVDYQLTELEADLL